MSEAASASYRVGRVLGRATATAVVVWLVWCVCKACHGDFAHALIAFVFSDAVIRAWSAK